MNVGETCHGLTSAQWMALWDDYGWRGRVKYSLVEVAICKEALPEHRLEAVQWLGIAEKFNLLPIDEGVPALLGSILLDIAAGDRGRWWLRARRRARAAQMVFGATHMLRIAMQLNQGATSVEDASESKLLS